MPGRHATPDRVSTPSYVWHPSGVSSATVTEESPRNQLEEDDQNNMGTTGRKSLYVYSHHFESCRDQFGKNRNMATPLSKVTSKTAVRQSWNQVTYRPGRTLGCTAQRGSAKMFGYRDSSADSSGKN